MDTLKVTTRNGQIAGNCSPGSNHDGVVTAAQLFPSHVRTDCDAGAEAGAFGLHLLQAAVNLFLLHFEVGDAVAEQAADLVVTFVHGNRVTDAGQLLCNCEACRTGPHHGNRLACEARRRKGMDPVVVEGFINDGNLNLLDGHGRLVDTQHAGRFAGCRAQTAGELREVVRGVEAFNRFLTLVPPHEVVPLGNQVAQRASLMAERNATVHAAAGLALQDTLFLGFVNFFPVHDADRNGTAWLRLALPDFQKSAWISHRLPPGFETILLRRRGQGPLRWRRGGFAGLRRSRVAVLW